METPTFTVHGNWRCASSSAGISLETQTIAGTHAPFALPIAPEPARTAATPSRTHIAITTDAIDDFFGLTRPRSLGGDIPPPPYADAELPAYSARPNTEPITLAMYCFKFGFRTSHGSSSRRRRLDV